MRTILRALKVIFLTSMVTTFLTACGGSGGGGVAGVMGTAALSNAKSTGVFANVSGLTYSTGSQAASTSASGAFSYKTGDTITFSVGDIVVGKATGRALVTPLHLIPGADAANTNVVNIMRFLMSIGTYDTSKLTISIPPAVLVAAKNKVIDFSTTTDQALLDMVRLLSGNSSATLVDTQAANSFLSRIIYKYYGGSYKGTFTGPASSNAWEMTINANDGTITGQGVGGAQEAIAGSMSGGINMTAIASGACVLSGQLNIFTGEFSGNWYYQSDKSRNGTFKGTK